MKKLIAASMAACLIGIGSVGCSNAPTSDTNDAEKISFTSCGKTSHFAHKPEKVLSMGVTGLAYLVAAGAEDKIIGRANEFGEPPAEWLKTEVENTKVLADSDMSLESIVSLQPDIVYGGGFSYEAATPDNITEKGVPAFVDGPECHYFYPDVEADESFDAIFAEVNKVGELFGTQGTAQKFVDKYRASVDAIKAKNLGQGRSVSFAYYFGEDQELFSYGDEGVMSEVMSTLGLENAIDPTYHPHQGPIAPEAFVKSNPDVLIVLVGMGGATKESTMQRLEKIPGFTEMKAVKDKKIFFANSAMAYASPTVFPYLEQVAQDFAEQS